MEVAHPEASVDGKSPVAAGTQSLSEGSGNSKRSMPAAKGPSERSG
jgi:hypothetical protein